MVKEKETSSISGNIQLWDNDSISPASEIDPLVDQNVFLFWTSEATYRKVSPTDLEIQIHDDESVLLVKGDLQEPIYYHSSHNNSSSGILRMFT